MRDRLLDALATVLLFWQDSVRPRIVYGLLFVRAIATWLAFIPIFGLSGTHFEGQDGFSWMSYNVNLRRLLIQRTKGKTVFLYTVQDVGPVTYLRLQHSNDISSILDNHAHEGTWRWRWNGKLVDGRRVAV